MPSVRQKKTTIMIFRRLVFTLAVSLTSFRSQLAFGIRQRREPPAQHRRKKIIHPQGLLRSRSQPTVLEEDNPLMPSSPNLLSTRSPSSEASTDPFSTVTTGEPSSIAFESDNGNGSTEWGHNEAAMIAAIVGGTCLISVSFIFLAYLVVRQKKIQKERQRQKPKTALTTQDGQLGNYGKNIIPGIVELDQQSLADTTLGEDSAARNRSKKISLQVIQHLDSFDENSLYTTPFSLKLEERSCRSTTVAPPSCLSSQQVKPIDCEGTILFPLSDTNTESSEGMYSSGPSSECNGGPASVDREPVDLDTSEPFERDTKEINLGPIDLDTNKPYLGEIGRALFSQPEHNVFDNQAFCEREGGDFGLTSHELDAWSYDFEEFDQEFAFHRDKTKSSSPPHSLKSNRKVKTPNSVLGSFAAPEEISQYSETSMEEEKREVEDTSDASSGRRQSEEEHMDIENSQSIKSVLLDSKDLDMQYRHLMADTLFDSVARSKTEDFDPVKSTPNRNRHSIPSVSDMEEASAAEETTISTGRPKRITETLGVQTKYNDSASSSFAGKSPSPLVEDTVEEPPGSKRVTADMKSLSGKSSFCNATESQVSFRSLLSCRSGREKAQSEASFTLKGLEVQLAALDSDATSSIGVSSITGTSFSTIPTRNRCPKLSRRRRIVVIVPPGKLGLILANRNDGSGTVISAIRDHSTLKGTLSPGDKLVAVDGEDVTSMHASQITSLIVSKAERERRLTMVTTASLQKLSQATESKSA